jgi:circadian clock protein KaiC
VGLDDITRGGIPRDRNTVVFGGPGCGKTVLALQTLVNGAMMGEPGIFVAFEENTRQIIQNAKSFGWDLARLEREQLFFLDARTPPGTVVAGEFDLVSLLAGIAEKAKAMRAKRIVFDSIDVLLSLLNDVTKEQQELHRLTEWLTAAKLTGIITCKSEQTAEGRIERYRSMPYMADCAIELTHQTTQRIAQRELQVVKYRGSAFSENAAPMVISSEGIKVAHISATERTFPVSNRRVSTGIARLDAMLGGGYFSGSSVLITGAPGTAKSTLSGAFVAAACRRGQRALYVSFDEIGGEHIRNLASVGIPLAEHVASGRLKIYSARTEATSVEEHLVHISGLIREHRAQYVVFDPLSALFRAGESTSVQSASERLLYFAKSAGITTVCTSLLTSPDWRVEGTPLEVSTIADTWIHLSYAVQAGERNRALTIVKSRGMKHSNQVRELILDDSGVTLADVYTGDGDVVMGTLRWQRDAKDKMEAERRRREFEHKQREVKFAEAELETRVTALRRELELKQLELQSFRADDIARLGTAKTYRDQLLVQRGADRPAGPRNPQRKSFR